MLSILIPTYNYDCLDLVKALYQECVDLGIKFQIFVSEDGGQKFIESNRQINELQYCIYIENTENLGRAGNINRLLNASTSTLKLILDCDVLPKSQNFINNYIKFAAEKERFVCFGGISYDNQKSAKHNLRYNYGLEREAKVATERQKHAYKYLLTSNILLKNCDILFDERIKTYGYDDMVFAKELKNKNIKAFHIDNAVFHLNLEDNTTYFRKTETALKTLIYLEKNNILSRGKTKISQLYKKFEAYHLVFALKLAYNLSNSFLKKRILKKGKPLYLFDLYKLFYFSKHY